MASDTSRGGGFLSKFTVLRGALRELWVVFAIKLLGIVAYSTMNRTFVLWFSRDLGYSDEAAGGWVALWSALMTLCTVLVGSLTDAIGLRRAFLLGALVCVVARAFLTFSTHPTVAIACGLIPLALGEALGTPVQVAAIRRYSTTAQRSISFSIFYAVMNLGFLIASLIFDFVRRDWLGETGVLRLPLPLGGLLELSSYRALFLISLAVQVLLVPLMLFGLREGVEATDQGVVFAPERPRYPGVGLFTAFFRLVRDTLIDSARIFAGLWRQPGFYKFLAFLGLAAFVRLIFIQMDYLYPKFGIRELGPGAPVGTLWGLNALLIIFLVPLVGALSQKIPAYTMVSVGSAVAAGSVFLMALPPAWFAGLADGALGYLVGRIYLRLEGPIHPYYVMIFLYVVILSVGESLYSPRLYEYAASIAPRGQEASYMSLSYLPFFLAKLCVATFSGVLLARFCPEDGPRNSAAMWLIVASTTAIAPVGLFLLRRYIRVAEAGREPTA